MKRVALFAFASLFVIACGSESPEDSDPVRSDTGASTDGAVADSAVEEDAAPEDTGADAASDSGTDAGKLTCTGTDPEPNDTRVTATRLKEIDDCDGSGGKLEGIVAGGADVDWFTYAGKDTTWCRVDVTASTSADVRVCVVAFCGSGATAFKSCAKGTKTTVAGVDGCCATGGQVELEHSCTLVGTSDNADVWMRVDDPGGTTCKSYSVDYHF